MLNDLYYRSEVGEVKQFFGDHALYYLLDICCLKVYKVFECAHFTK